MSEPVFSRVLLKLSGEVLANDYGFGISPEKVSYLAKQIKPIYEANVDIGLIIGAGNIFRGVQAAGEGIAEQLKEAGFEWRLAGCSMCLAMNPDQLAPGERCAATSNRNFEGRQGRGGRTHLMSPAMAAAAAVTGRLSDVRNL